MVGGKRIIVALDVADAERAVRLAMQVRDHVAGLKVGLGLLYGAGPGIVTALVDIGLPVFADAKLHDIPSQVGAASRRLGRLGIRWMTVHMSGGDAMVRAAVEGLGETSPGHGGVLGVTVLTSLDAASLVDVGITATPGRLVSKMARLAASTGCEGVICSPQELTVVGEVAPGMLRVTPGIRPAGDEHGDQARVMTPEEAVRRGADLLVVGRPITGADDPEAAAAALAQATEIPDPEAGG